MPNFQAAELLPVEGKTMPPALPRVCCYCVHAAAHLHMSGINHLSCKSPTAGCSGGAQHTHSMNMVRVLASRFLSCVEIPGKRDIIINIVTIIIIVLIIYNSILLFII